MTQAPAFTASHRADTSSPEPISSHMIACGLRHLTARSIASAFAKPVSTSQHLPSLKGDTQPHIAAISPRSSHTVTRLPDSDRYLAISLSCVVFPLDGTPTTSSPHRPPQKTLSVSRALHPITSLAILRLIEDISRIPVSLSPSYTALAPNPAL